MNEHDLKEDLMQAYPVEPLPEDKLMSIARRVRVGTMRKRSRRRWFIGVGVFVGLSAAVGFTYPVAAANLFGLQLVRNMKEVGSYRVRITLDQSNPDGGQTRQVPLDMYVDGKDEYMTNVTPGALTFEHVDGSHVMRMVHPASHVALVYPPNPDSDAFFRIPLQIVDQLSHFDLKKSIRSIGTKTVNGRLVDELALTTTENGKFLLDVDDEKGLIVSMTLPSGAMKSDSKDLPVFGAGMRFDYTYGDDDIKKIVAECKQAERGLRTLHVLEDKPKLGQQLCSKALSANNTGRDVLRVYQVQQNAKGDIFVLYSCEGYHADDQMPGTWLQLRDEQGRPWLSTFINMFASGDLAPKGQGTKAQLFFHPDTAARIRTAHLSIRLNDWEYIRPEFPSTSKTRVLDLGAFTPTDVDCVPVWYFYAFGIQDESWVTWVSKKFRFQHALDVKDYRGAIRMGLEFYSELPEMVLSLFYNKADIAYGLGEAYRGIGDLQNAKKYEGLSDGAEWEPTVARRRSR